MSDRTDATQTARIEQLSRAVELEVDRSEVALSPSEEALWRELEAEFEDRVARLGRVWVAG